MRPVNLQCILSESGYVASGGCAFGCLPRRYSGPVLDICWVIAQDDPHVSQGARRIEATLRRCVLSLRIATRQ